MRIGIGTKSVILRKRMEAVTQGQIQKSILIFRGHRVLTDSDLSGLYGVTTKYLNQQVRRNLDRFPEDFMFQLSEIDK